MYINGEVHYPRKKECVYCDVEYYIMSVSKM